MEEERLTEFIEYASRLKGRERGEAQLFLDRLFIAFGNKGVIEAEATLERPIIIDSQTKFCDLIWPGIVIIEMKKRGEKLEKHVIQAKSYWDNAYTERTEYVILCNFDEFWIYNWNMQRDPVDKIHISKLKEMWRSLAFLSPKGIKPIFGNNLVEVTKKAADKIAILYNSLILRGVEKNKAQRFTLQCLVALFAEDAGLFPRKGFFCSLVDDCLNGDSSYDLFKLLFDQMNNKKPAKGGRFQDIKYFDGGIFSENYPIELNRTELKLLSVASKHDWSKVQPSIFGNIFEESIDEEERHKTGAHFTYESDIMRIVEPTILKPWRKIIKSAKTLGDFENISKELSKFKVLDPACGSGNFLYISYRELKHLELEMFQKMLNKFPSTKPQKLRSSIKASQFYGIETLSLGVELAKITLSMAKKFAADEFEKFTNQYRLIDFDGSPLPFDNLDQNIVQGDALFCEWPKVDVIIGNPPFQSKNKMQKEFGRAYLNKLHDKFPDMPGLADYCVYWFRKAHDELANGGRAGLVGTNTISQTNSRIGGLDYILSNDGTIVEAVSTMPWSGKAVVHVAIVNWIKGPIRRGKRKLAIQRGFKKDGPWEEYDLAQIPSSLSHLTDVTGAKKLAGNKILKSCYQGQTHGNKGFLLTPNEKDDLTNSEPLAEEVIFPFLTAEDLIGDIDSQPSRFVIDFQPRDIFSARSYTKTFKHVEEAVLPDRKEAYENENKRNEEALNDNPDAKINKHHERFFHNWWLLSYGREDLINKIEKTNRYVVCGQVTKRPIFEFVSSHIRPNAALVVFAFEDDYSFGILQSNLHWEWFKARCSTLKGDFRYTSNTVFDTFPWPQWGIIKHLGKTQPSKSKLGLAINIANAAREFREMRDRIRKENNYSLREIYRLLDMPGNNLLRDAQQKLDKAVREAYNYGLPSNFKKMPILDFLLELNSLCFEAEQADQEIIAPGLPKFCEGHKEFFSTDCLKIIWKP